jgi:hypothetical protein
VHPFVPGVAIPDNTAVVTPAPEIELTVEIIETAVPNEDVPITDPSLVQAV